jgi:hypothetical protein
MKAHLRNEQAPKETYHVLLFRNGAAVGHLQLSECRTEAAQRGVVDVQSQ